MFHPGDNPKLVLHRIKMQKRFLYPTHSSTSQEDSHKRLLVRFPPLFRHLLKQLQRIISHPVVTIHTHHHVPRINIFISHVIKHSLSISDATTLPEHTNHHIVQLRITSKDRPEEMVVHLLGMLKRLQIGARLEE
ncbi:hypothetical protein N665_0062s0103 [Sinapis alba]|nr:hypothetical protein N665_0062s0103 [Sinapis alba]